MTIQSTLHTTIQQSLEELGLSAFESTVYVDLVNTGLRSVQELARRLSAPRSSVYTALESLTRRRLVTTDSSRRALRYRAESPQALSSALQEHREILEHRERTLAKITQQIHPLLTARVHSEAKLEISEGRTKVERFLFDNLDRWRDSILRCDQSTWGFQDPSFVEEYSKWIKVAWRVLHVEAQISGRILSNSSSTERQLKSRIPRREVRILPRQYQFESSTWVMGDYVVVIMTRTEPFYALQIREPMLASNLRMVFKILYESSSAIGA